MKTLNWIKVETFMVSALLQLMDEHPDCYDKERFEELGKSYNIGNACQIVVELFNVEIYWEGSYTAKTPHWKIVDGDTRIRIAQFTGINRDDIYRQLKAYFIERGNT